MPPCARPPSAAALRWASHPGVNPGCSLVGVGLLYQKGYFQQALDPDGWQQERTPVNDFYSLPIQPAHDADGRQHTVYVDLPTGPVAIRVWTMDVGRVRMLFLDANTPENPRADRTRRR